MGLLDSLNQGLSQGMTSPLFNLGMGLMQGAAAQPGQGGYGAAMQSAANTYQNQRTAQQQYQMSHVQLQMLQQEFPAVMQGLNKLGAMVDPGSQGGGLMGSATQQAAGAPPPPQTGAPTQAGGASAAPPGLLNGGAPMVAAPQPAGPAPASAAGPTGQPAQAGAAPAPSGADPDPFAIMRAAIPLVGSIVPGAKEQGQAYITYAQQLLANDPRFITAKAVAGDQMTQDLAQLDAAQKSGAPTRIAAATMAFLTHSKAVDIANNNNAVTTFGGISPAALGMNAINPGQGTITLNGVQAPIPGAPQTQEALAGAHARGEAQGELQEMTDASGAITGQPGAKYYVQRSSLLTGGAGSGGAPAGAMPPNGARSAPIAAQGPEAQSQQSAAGTAAGTQLGELNKNADAARQANYTLDQLRALGQGATLGPAAPAREWFEQVATPLAQAFGLQPPKELATYEQINKFGNQLAFNASKQMGSREAAQIVQLQIQSNPNKGLVPDAYNGLIDSMSAMNNYIIAKNSAVQGAATGNQISARQATANWETKVDPTVWDLAVSPMLAARVAGKLGAPKIATALPLMASDDAVSAMRNLATPMQQQVLRALPPAAKQEILRSLRSTQQTGGTGTY